MVARKKCKNYWRVFGRDRISVWDVVTGNRCVISITIDGECVEMMGEPSRTFVARLLWQARGQKATITKVKGVVWSGK